MTLFGGASVLLFVLSVAYCVGDWRRVLTLVGYAFVALSVVVVVDTLIGAVGTAVVLLPVAAGQGPARVRDHVIHYR